MCVRVCVCVCVCVCVYKQVLALDILQAKQPAYFNHRGETNRCYNCQSPVV